MDSEAIGSARPRDPASFRPRNPNIPTRRALAVSSQHGRHNIMNACLAEITPQEIQHALERMLHEGRLAHVTSGRNSEDPETPGK